MAYFFNRQGAIYFAKHLTCDVVKIGFARDPVVRLWDVAWRGRYNRFRVLGSLQGTGRLELAMHKRFAHARIKTKRGTEFFKYSAIAAEINEVLSAYLERAGK